MTEKDDKYDFLKPLRNIRLTVTRPRDDYFRPNIQNIPYTRRSKISKDVWPDEEEFIRFQRQMFELGLIARRDRLKVFSVMGACGLRNQRVDFPSPPGKKDETDEKK